MIAIRELHKSYGTLEVLKGLSIDIAAGEIVAIVGPSGAGKSTLLQIIGTLDKPDRGELIFDQKSVFQLNDQALSAFRNKTIGFVFQQHHLLPEFTAIENVLIPAMIAGRSPKEALPYATELCTLLGVKDRMEHKPAALSGGEQQRFAVARALINRPKVVLADEPSGNLDTHNARELHQLFFELRARYGQTFVIVTHNTGLADMADRKITLVDGKLSA
jgi:lipoprotein-releasing system ATP-binding protein